jgi:LmbE family N-acetylglucosaminyl deacetylase
MAAAAAAFGFKNLFQMTFPDIPVRDPVTGKPTRDPHFFLKPDGPWPLNEIQKKISAIAVAVAPDMVITFYPGQTDIHAHHQATAEIAKGLYVQHTLGAAAKNIYGFRENVSTEAGDLQARLKLAQQWLLFSPKKISPITGLSYGQMGSKAELLHKSQMNATTGAFVKNWQQEPDEAFASIDESKDLSALKEALGDLFQNDLSLENRDNEIGSR